MIDGLSDHGLVSPATLLFVTNGLAHPYLLEGKFIVMICHDDIVFNFIRRVGERGSPPQMRI